MSSVKNKDGYSKNENYINVGKAMSKFSYLELTAQDRSRLN